MSQPKTELTFTLPTGKEIHGMVPVESTILFNAIMDVLDGKRQALVIRYDESIEIFNAAFIKQCHVEIKNVWIPEETPPETGTMH